MPAQLLDIKGVTLHGIALAPIRDSVFRPPSFADVFKELSETNITKDLTMTRTDIPFGITTATNGQGGILLDSYGKIWVTPGYNTDRILKLDPETNSVSSFTALNYTVNAWNYVPAVHMPDKCIYAFPSGGNQYVLIIDTVTNVVSRVDLGAGHEWGVIGAYENYVYVRRSTIGATTNTHCLGRFDTLTRTMTLLAPNPLTYPTGGIASDWDGKTIWIAPHDKNNTALSSYAQHVAKFDMTTETYSPVLPVSGTEHLYGYAAGFMGRDGNITFFPNSDTAGYLLYNPVTNTVAKWGTQTNRSWVLSCATPMYDGRGWFHPPGNSQSWIPVDPVAQAQVSIAMGSYTMGMVVHPNGKIYGSGGYTNKNFKVLSFVSEDIEVPTLEILLSPVINISRW